MGRGGRWGVGGGEARGPSWKGRIKGVEGWRGLNLCVRAKGNPMESSVADLDPGSDAFLTPGSGIRDPGWVESQDPGSGMNNPDHIF
jgi:hypothetical protein